MGLFIIITTFIAIFVLTKNLNPHKIPCHLRNEPHKWTYRGEKGMEYMVCSECKMLPGGDFEESD